MLELLKYYNKKIKMSIVKLIFVKSALGKLNKNPVLDEKTGFLELLQCSERFVLNWGLILFQFTDLATGSRSNCCNRVFPAQRPCHVMAYCNLLHHFAQ